LGKLVENIKYDWRAEAEVKTFAEGLLYGFSMVGMFGVCGAM